jgi:hypothetical protein
LEDGQPHEAPSGRSHTLAPLQLPPLMTAASGEVVTPMAGVVTQLLPTCSVADQLPASVMGEAGGGPAGESQEQRDGSGFLFTVPDPATAAGGGGGGGEGGLEGMSTPLLRPSVLLVSEAPTAEEDPPSPDLIHVAEAVLPEHVHVHPGAAGPHPASLMCTHPSTPASSEQYASATTSPGVSPLPVLLEEPQEGALTAKQWKAAADAQPSNMTLDSSAPQHSLKSKLSAEPGVTPSTRSSGAGVSVTSMQGGQAPSSEQDPHTNRQGSDVGGGQQGARSRGQQQQGQQQRGYSSRSHATKGTPASKTGTLPVAPLLSPPVVKGIPLYHALATAIKGNRQSVVAAYSNPIFLAEEGLSHASTLADRSV